MRKYIIIGLLSVIFLFPSQGNGQGWNIEILGLVYYWNFADDIYVSGNSAYVAGNDDGLIILDVTDPENPFETGGIMFGSPARGVFVSGNYAYVAADAAGLIIVDISEPFHPGEVGSFNTPGESFGVYVAGNYAYVADYDEGLRVIDVSNPTNPFQTGFIQTNNIAKDVIVSGNYAYVSVWASGMSVYDVSNPFNPIICNLFNTPGETNNIDLYNNHAYLADYNSGLRIVNVTNPFQFVETAVYNTPGYAFGVDVVDNYTYVADYDEGLLILNTANPSHPVFAGQLDMPGNTVKVSKNGDYAYTANFNEGICIADVSDPASPELLCNYLRQGIVEHLAISGNYLYAADPVSDLRIYDVSNPSILVETGGCSAEGEAWEIAVQGNFVYLCGSQGVRIIYAIDPQNPMEVNSFNYGGCGGVAFSGNYIYSAFGNGGLVVENISNPFIPVFVAQTDTLIFADSSGSHGSYSDLAISGNYAYVAANDSGMHVFDISNPFNPHVVGRYRQFPGMVWKIAVSGNYAFVVGQNDEMHIVDVSIPSSPHFVGSFESAFYCEDIAAEGNYVFLPNDDEGFSIVNVSNPANPIETGNYETNDHVFGIAVSGDIVFLGEAHSMQILDCSTALGAGAEIILNPINPPITIPPPGGTFNYTISISNPLPLPVTCDAWVNVILPNGTTMAGIINRTVNLAAEDTLIRQMAQFVPANAPAGQYTYIGYIGEFGESVIDSSLFTFTKTAGENCNSVNNAWLLTGWDESPANLSTNIPPISFKICSIYPNPFNNSTAISFTLPADGEISLKIYDISGREITTIDAGYLSSGKHNVVWNAEGLASGVYFIRLTAGSKQESVRKVVLMK